MEKYQTLFLQMFLLFHTPPFLGFQLHIYLTIWYHPIVLTLFWHRIFFIFFYLRVSIFVISIDLSLGSPILSSTVSSQLMNKSKAFITVTVFFISTIFIWFFLYFHSLLKLLIWSCMLSTFYTWVFDIVIIIILISCLIFPVSVSYLSKVVLIAMSLDSTLVFLTSLCPLEFFVKRWR